MSGNSTARVSYKQLRLASVAAETADPVHPPRLGDLEPEARGAGVGRPSGDFALVESDLEGALECGEHVAGLVRRRRAAGTCNPGRGGGRGSPSPALRRPGRALRAGRRPT